MVGMGRQAYEGPQSLSEEMRERYAYPQGFRYLLIDGEPQRPLKAFPDRKVVEYKQRLLKEKKGYRVYGIEFPFVGQGVPEPIQIEFFEQKKAGKHPTIVVSPVYRENYALSRFVSGCFARHGFNSCIVYRWRELLRPDQEVSELEETLRLTVIRYRQVVDFLSQREQVDPQRLCSYGMSAGGVVNTLVAAIEKRLKVHVIGLAGGSVADLLSKSHESNMKRFRKTYMARKGVDLEGFHSHLWEGLETDTLKLAPYIDARRVLFIMAMFDTTVTTNSCLRLSRAMGNPKRIHLPFNHYALIFLPLLLPKVRGFYEGCLEKEALTPQRKAP